LLKTSFEPTVTLCLRVNPNYCPSFPCKIYELFKCYSQNVLEDDESVLDLALENGLFHVLPHTLITKKTLTNEEFYFRRIHQLITDLIVLMPLKVLNPQVQSTSQIRTVGINRIQFLSECRMVRFTNG
jgi:hypothetical protein